MKKTQPNKRYSLTLWYLLYRTDVFANIDEQYEGTACKRFSYKWDDYQAEKLRFPEKFKRMLRKRQLRRQQAQQCGYTHDGHTPEDPDRKDNRQNNRAYTATLLGYRGLNNTKRVAKLAKHGILRTGTRF